ncbi:MAG TPA: response regulator transcription factor [Anseongella sp.]|nr:response regulator transcription factor [Anseongella sp.]
MKILLVEDEPSVASFIKKGLEEQQHEVMLTYDGETALQLLEGNSWDIIVLDVILPRLSGLEVCRIIRENLSLSTPVLMLTALGSTDNIVKGLETGADDYLVKPFKFKELLARLKALVRRRDGETAPVKRLVFADIEMDMDKKTVTRAGRPVVLTSREFLLLEYFMKNPNRVISRTEILENVWEINFDLGSNVIDVYISYLRNKIDKEFEHRLIHTKVGMGYIMQEG